MTTYIGNAPIENQIRALANFLESAPERQIREQQQPEKKDDAINQTESNNNNNNTLQQQSTAKNAQSQFLLKIDELTTKKESEKALLEILKERLFEALLINSTEKDVENFFLLTFGLIRRLTGPNRKEIVDRVLSVLTTTPPQTTKAQLRLSLINIFYNSLLPTPTSSATGKTKPKKKKQQQNQQPQAISAPHADYFSTNFTERLETLQALINYAFQINQSQLITPLIPQFLSWAQSWHSTSASHFPISLYQSLILLITSHLTPSSPLYFSLSIQYLGSFTNSDEFETILAENSKIKQIIQDLIKDLIQNEDKILEIEQLRAIPIVQFLTVYSKDQEGKIIGEILKALCFGGVKEWKNQEESVRRWIDTNGIKADQVDHKMKLLELTKLGQGGKEVSYETVRDSLGLQSGRGWEEEVENWIIIGISVGVIDARLDQLRKVIVVDRVAQREFGREQWEQIGNKLGTWRKTVGDLLKMIESRKTAAVS